MTWADFEYIVFVVLLSALVAVVVVVVAVAVAAAAVVAAAVLPSVAVVAGLVGIEVVADAFAVQEKVCSWVYSHFAWVVL